MQQAVLMQAAHEVVALAGFHIKRQEFEPEYDNEAEMVVADMEFRDDDTEVSMHACTALPHHELSHHELMTVVVTLVVVVIFIVIVGIFITNIIVIIVINT